MTTRAGTLSRNDERTARVSTIHVVREVRLPWWTLLKLFAACLAAWAAIELWAPFELVLVAAVFAIALSPLVDSLERRGISRGWSVALLALTVLLFFVLFVVFVLPPLTSQVSQMWQDLPKIRQSLVERIGHQGLAARILLPVADLPRSAELDEWLSKPLTWGPAAVGVLAGGLLVVVLAFYLILDGRKVVAWLLAYVPRNHRRAMSAMVPEVFSVVQAYTTSQLICSTLFATFSFAVLSLLGVPAALPVALLAGLCDVLPVVGIFLATAPAVACALTVSGPKALLVGAIFLAYHLFEAYFLLPRLLGNRLRLSTLSVLLAIIAGGALDGVLGAILALPVVAAYPVVEKHWLDGYLHADLVEDHAALRDSDAEEHEAAVDAVLEGKAPEPAPAATSSPVA